MIKHIYLKVNSIIYLKTDKVYIYIHTLIRSPSYILYKTTNIVGRSTCNMELARC